MGKAHCIAVYLLISAGILGIAHDFHDRGLGWLE
jgi:hypothetical protein